MFIQKKLSGSFQNAEGALAVGMAPVPQGWAGVETRARCLCTGASLHPLPISDEFSGGNQSTYPEPEIL
jgi:hypothetical protein